MVIFDIFGDLSDVRYARTKATTKDDIPLVLRLEAQRRVATIANMHRLEALRTARCTKASIE
jgi:hypothetical protein